MAIQPDPLSTRTASPQSNASLGNAATGPASPTIVVVSGYNEPPIISLNKKVTKHPEEKAQAPAAKTSKKACSCLCSSKPKGTQVTVQQKSAQYKPSITQQLEDIVDGGKKGEI